MWLAHIRDTQQYIYRQKLLTISTADYPIHIKFIKVRDFGNKKGYRRGFRYIEGCCCAETFVDDNECTQLIFWYPRPESCPYDDFEAMIRLINHEVMHIVLEDFDTDEGDKAKMGWDKIKKQMYKILPDTYCEC